MQRRTLLQLLAALAFAPAGARPARGETAPLHTRAIPASGEQLPVIGMGSWITFDVEDATARAQRVPVLQAFFDRGGALIDSSPMYGFAEETIGECLRKINNRERLFAATKVWTPGRWLGIKQMEASFRLWGLTRFDLMQIHNMVDWETHLETFRTWKADGRIRYIGITTSHGSRHREMEQALTREKFDFVQFTYNLADREVEQRLLPLAAERGIAVIVNRPFQRGGLFERVRGKALPVFAQDFDCANWPQYFLKFVVSHPNVTCAIPATTRVDHMIENMGAATGRLPDPEQRRRMIAHWRTL